MEKDNSNRNLPVQTNGTGDKNRRQKVQEAAICFARMWGVMETLEPLQALEFETVREIVTAWAEEFVATNQDLVAFFNEKSEKIKETYKHDKN